MIIIPPMGCLPSTHAPEVHEGETSCQRTCGSYRQKGEMWCTERIQVDLMLKSKHRLLHLLPYNTEGALVQHWVLHVLGNTEFLIFAFIQNEVMTKWLLASWQKFCNVEIGLALRCQSSQMCCAHADESLTNHRDAESRFYVVWTR